MESGVQKFKDQDEFGLSWFLRHHGVKDVTGRSPSIVKAPLVISESLNRAGEWWSSGVSILHHWGQSEEADFVMPGPVILFLLLCTRQGRFSSQDKSGFLFSNDWYLLRMDMVSSDKRSPFSLQCCRNSDGNSFVISQQSICWYSPQCTRPESPHLLDERMPSNV